MDYSKLGTAAAEAEDMTQNKSFERELPRAGVALLRLKDYIETGRHESNVAGYKPALKTMLTFELNHPDHMIEIDGKKVYAKAILKDPETYFTEEVMEKLDAIAREEFSYGS